MKPANIQELRSQLLGTITDAKAVNDYFANDGSILEITPAAVAYPQTVSDVQSLVAYAAAQRANPTADGPAGPIAITARGYGSDSGGGALTSSLAAVMPAQLAKVVRLHKDVVTVQAGVSLATLQQVLRTHGRWVPIGTPATDDATTTIGGSVAAGGGSGSPKYGATANWVKGVKVVLDDGSLIEARRISRWELNRKKGRMTREGDLYRGIDGLLQDHRSLIAETQPATSLNAAGYRLETIKRRDGSFDLSRLFGGAEGTLGVITEVTLGTVPYEPRRTLLVGCFDGWEAVSATMLQLRQYNPSAVEALDAQALDFVRSQQPALLTDLLPDTTPAVTLLVEFDDVSHLRQNRHSRRAVRLITKLGTGCRTVSNKEEQRRLWTAWRHVASARQLAVTAGPKPLPILAGSAVPIDRLPELASEAKRLLHKHKTESPLWGPVGVGSLCMQPAIDLGKANGRRAAIKVMDEFYGLVIQCGGTPAATVGDGRLRTPYLEKLYGHDMYHVLQAVKQLCDPGEIFNPGVKFGGDKPKLESILRHNYNPHGGYEYL